MVNSIHWLDVVERTVVVGIILTLGIFLAFVVALPFNYIYWGDCEFQRIEAESEQVFTDAGYELVHPIAHYRTTVNYFTRAGGGMIQYTLRHPDTNVNYTAYLEVDANDNVSIRSLTAVDAITNE